MNNKLHIKTILIMLAGIISTFINIVIFTEISSAQSLIPTVFEGQGYKLSYLGKTYNVQNNVSTFRYNLSRGLLAQPLTALKFPLGDNALANPLTGVLTDLPHLLGQNSQTGENFLGFTGSPLPALSKNIDLNFLGNVEEDDTDVSLQAGNLAPLSLGKIKGAKLLNILGGDSDGGDTDAELPECITSIPQPVIAPVGEKLNIPFNISAQANSLVNVDCTNLPDGANCSVPSGSLVPSNSVVDVSWIPELSDVGTGYKLPVQITDQLNNLSLCNVVVNVVEDSLPKLNVDLAGSQACQGVSTLLALDGSASYDPEGKPLSYKWTSDCQNSSINGDTSSRPTIKLSDPGQGVPQNCNVTLVASDGKKTSATLFPLAVPACNVNCNDSEKDLCGVCNGSNLCIDCAGQLNGGKAVDRCGVCGGNNSCVDCQGTLSGNKTADLCGICGGNDSTCRYCLNQDHTRILRLLDSSALAQAQVITKGIRSQSKQLKHKLKKYDARAHELYNKNWALVWSLQTTSLSCSNYSGCASNNHTSSLDEYKKGARELLTLSTNLAGVLKKSKQHKSAGKYKKIVRTSKRIFNKIFEDVKDYPLETHTCN